MSDRAALAAHFTPAQVAADLAQHSPAEVWAQRVRLDTTGRLSQHRPEIELSNAELTCRFLIPTDAQWPSALADLGPACPLGLWVRGHHHLPELTASTVVVTGNRAPSPEAVERSTAFAEAGHTVAASLAYGVAATAYAGAHLMGRPTLAVLPRGLDQAYPHNHGPLLNAITNNGGAALSLYRPGTVTSGATLQASATLLAALSRAVILIEALDHAQALRTAEAAIDLKRTPLAIPSHSGIRSGGNTRLLDERPALPCPSPSRALELF